MALPAYSPRVGQITGAEEGLSLAALDPMKTGAALPLLFGAQAVRQDANASYDANNQFSQRLAQQIQDQTNAHQIREDRNTSLNISQPGGAAIAALSPGSGIDLNDPQTLALLDAMKNRQFAASDAKTFSENAGGVKSSVEAGFVPGLGDVSQKYGFVPQATDPLSLRVEGMRQSGANARAAAGALQASVPKYSVEPDPNNPGKVIVRQSNIDQSQLGTAAADTVQLNASQPSSYVKDGVTYAVPNPNMVPQTGGVLKDRRSKQVVGAIPPYKGGTSTSPNTSAPPTSGVPAGVPADALQKVPVPPAVQQQLARGYIASKGNVTGAQAAQIQAESQRIGVGRTPDGKMFVTLDGKSLGVPVK